jgi:ribosome maturation factor RimP
VQTDGTVSRVRSIAERVARDQGLEVFDVQFRREPVGWVLRVILDRPARRDPAGVVQVESVEESIGLDECRRVSDDLSAVLDVEDVIEPHYTLEVSSPGLDRPLRGVEDYCRFRGRMAKVVVREPVDGQVHFEGRLGGVHGDALVLAVGHRGSEKRLALGNIVRARLGVEF